MLEVFRDRAGRLWVVLRDPRQPQCGAGTHAVRACVGLDQELSNLCRRHRGPRLVRGRRQSQQDRLALGADFVGGVGLEQQTVQGLDQ